MPDERIVSRTDKWDHITDKITMDQAVSDLALSGYDRDTIECDLRSKRRFEILRYTLYIE